MCNKINEFTDERIDLMQGFKHYTIMLCVLYIYIKNEMAPVVTGYVKYSYARALIQYAHNGP